MYFWSDRGIFKMHSHPRVAKALADAQVTYRKNNNEMAKKTHNKLKDEF